MIDSEGSANVDLTGLSVSLARMSRDLLTQTSVQATLDHIVVHAVDLIDGCEDAGVLVLRGRRTVETAAASSARVRASDQAQQDCAEGPCFDAAFEKQQLYRIADMTTTERWIHYAPRALELGIGSMMGFLLYTEEGDLGALDLYSSQPNAFNDRSELAGWLLASHAAVGFAGARSAAQLQNAVATRQSIGQAIGIAMERYKIPDDRAFELLKKISQDRNVKLRDLAEAINAGREL